MEVGNKKKERREKEIFRETERKKSKKAFSFTGSLLKCSQWPGLGAAGGAEPRSQCGYACWRQDSLLLYSHRKLGPNVD